NRMLLFTGEEPSPATARVGGLDLALGAGSTRVRFSGPVLLAADARRYFERERGQAEARGADPALDPELARGARGGVGAGRGRVVIDGTRLDVATQGFVTTGFARASLGSGRSITRVRASFGRELGVIVTVRTPHGPDEVERFAAGIFDRALAPVPVRRPASIH